MRDWEEMDWEGIRKALRLLKQYRNSCGTEVVLHGGEPTSVPLDVLERLMKLIRSEGFNVGMQSNGYAITEDHIRLFKRYGCHVGISVDGFPDINTLRGFFDEQGREIKPASEEYRKRVMENLEILISEKLCGGVITILHRANAGDARRLERLKEFLKWLEERGAQSVRLNPMSADAGPAKAYELTNEELARAYIELYEYCKGLRLKVSPFIDMRRTLLGERETVCWFSGCHLYDSLVWAIDNRGNILSCDRILGWGTLLRPSQLPHTDMFRMQVRTLALLQTELRDDPYAHLHRGGCPAEGIGGDWRRPSRFVPAFDKLFAKIEEDLRKALPDAIFPTEYPDKVRYVKMIDAGYRWDIWRGDFTR